eukprot:TRINITY_DN15498_c0_g4_i1.p1 TRINITY_DN15498_c0_g4~~TRINITY_DN15498_c0_g4_i1.p1  ORF type:complete len:321 (+),score=94.16 TRINITY_DN15498_c0_g4_i1:58-1020(+)
MRACSARGPRSGRRAPQRSGSPTRAGLCAHVEELREERERLRRLTCEQREQLAILEEDCVRVRNRLAEADLARAGLACESCASRCAADVARLQCRQLDAERQRLEQELESFKRGAARLREARDLDLQHDAERAAWSDEERRLEREIATTREKLASLAGLAEQQAAERSAIAWHQSATCALEEDLAQQRRLREDAERQLRAAQAELVAVSSSAGAAAAARPEAASAERSKLNELRLQLTRVTEERQRRRGEIQASLSELERMRQDLQILTDDNAHLRSGLQRTLQSLGRIQRQSAEAEALAAGSCASARFQPPVSTAPRLW